jgi:hypothetical protein
MAPRARDRFPDAKAMREAILEIERKPESPRGSPEAGPDEMDGG